MFKNNRLLYLLLAATIIIASAIVLYPHLLASKFFLGDRKIYTDKEFGYSVLVPKDWSINSSFNPVQFFTKSQSATESSVLHMEIFATPQDLSLSDYISSLDSSGSGTFETLTVNGHPVYKESLSNVGKIFSSYYFQNPESPTLYILTFSPELASQSTLVENILSSFKFLAPVSTSIIPLPTSATSSSEFTCPNTGWIDCMPGVNSQKTECTEEFVNWASKNCPNFKGVAY